MRNIIKTIFTSVQKLRIGKTQLLIKSSTLDIEPIKLFINSISDIKYDLKNRIVDIHIIEPENDMFYKHLNNFFADKDIKLVIKNFNQIANNKTKVFQERFPFLLFESGQVIKHECKLEYDCDDQYFEHVISMKFNKFDFKYELVRGFDE